MILLKTCSVLLTILFFYAAKRLNKKRPSLLFSPAVLAPAAMIVFLLVAGVPYVEYSQATSWISEMMGVVTVAFAVPLYRNWAILMAHRRMILLSLATGSLIAILAGAQCIGSDWRHAGDDSRVRDADELCRSVSGTVGH